MTDDRTPETPRPGGSDHADIESLSALLDGEDPSAEAHAGSCALCAERLAGLARVRAELARPAPPPPEEVRQRALAAALAAASAGTASAETPAASPPFQAPRISGLERPARSEVPPPRFARSTPWVAALSVAALVLLVALAAGLVGPGRRDVSTTAAPELASPEEKAFEAQAGRQQDAGAGASGAVAAAGAPAGDLGPVRSGAELAARVRTLVAARAEARPESSAAAPSPAPPAEAQRSAATADQALAAGGPCDTEGLAAVSRPGSAPSAPVLRATALYEGEPAVVLVYPAAPNESPAAFRALALSQEDCRLLASALVAPATP